MGDGDSTNKGGPLKRLARGVSRLPIPTLGRWTPVVGLVGLIMAVVLFGLVAALTLRGTLASPNLNPFYAEDVIPTAPGATPNPEFAADEVVSSDDDRVTVLLLGADTRASETGYRTLTDSIMLLTIDRANGTAGMLSIPRDLYVDIPGYGLDRINTAYVKGGGQLAMQTVEYNLGVEVDHFVVVQFDTVVTLIDEIGGIVITVPYEIYDEEFPADCDTRDCGFDPLYISAGRQHMDGDTALRYARTRHGDSDIERAGRQQQVIMAIRDQVLSADQLPRLISRAPSLYNTLQATIRTDMTLDQMIALAADAGELADEDIRRGVIGFEQVNETYNEQGSYVLVPMQEPLSALIRDVFWLEG